MEYMAGGELYDRLFQHRVYKEEMAAKTAKQMLLAVGALAYAQVLYVCVRYCLISFHIMINVMSCHALYNCCMIYYSTCNISG